MVIETLREWNHWWNKKEVEKELLGKERKILRDLEKYSAAREIKLLIGVRRSGKSTLFYQKIDHLLKNNVKPEEVLLINFEDDVLSKKTLREIFDVYQSEIGSNTKPYIFLDEIHRCNEWVPFLRKLYDLKKVKEVFITDSSSKFIEKEYSGALTGRTISFTVSPLSFSEYLNWKGRNAKTPDREEINKIKKELREFLNWGGFPEIFFEPEAIKKKLLTEYFGAIINKDIIERYNANHAKIKQLADFLISNATSVFSPRQYSRNYGLSLESIDTYLQYFKEVLLFSFIPKFSYSVKAQQLSPKKIYVCDLGFFSNAGFKFSENEGRAYENVVFLELQRKNREIYYWKDKYECDFIVKKGIKVREAIQVCSNLTLENKEREIKGILEALNKFKLRAGTIITNKYESKEDINGKTIYFTPLWKWLLAPA